jgi:hypothetical protein
MVNKMKMIQARNVLIVQKVKTRLFILNKFFSKLKLNLIESRNKNDIAILHYAPRIMLRAFRLLWRNYIIELKK